MPALQRCGSQVPSAALATAMGARSHFPQTVYLNRQGKTVHDHIGAYASAGALEQDIRRYVLSSS